MALTFPFFSRRGLENIAPKAWPAVDRISYRFANRPRRYGKQRKCLPQVLFIWVTRYRYFTEPRCFRIENRWGLRDTCHFDDDRLGGSAVCAYDSLARRAAERSALAPCPVKVVVACRSQGCQPYLCFGTCLLSDVDSFGLGEFRSWLYKSVKPWYWITKIARYFLVKLG